jgi:hypothetical protein
VPQAASDLLGVRQAVLARRHCPGTHPARPRGSGGPRTDASHSARHVKPDTVADSGHRKPPAAPPDGTAWPEPGPTIPIGLDLFHNGFRPRGFRYQRGFSTRSGNDGKLLACSGQTGHETGPVNSRADRPAARAHARYIRRSG